MSELPPPEAIRLTQYSRAAGCGCKIAPAVLETLLKGNISQQPFPALLVGTETQDDAAVYDLGNGQAIISTTDFFMPIVDDAFDFGRVAAANAISDVYAMGGQPLMALAILGWPIEKLEASLASRVLDGARSICNEAGIPLAGGHSIDSAEPIFGLSVTGLVAKDELKRNNTARAGDWLLLTKPLGTGILSTAQKRELMQPEHRDAWLQELTRLNKIGAPLASIPGVTAMTDVTGFGLLGHLLEICSGADLSAEIYYSQLQLLPGTKEYIAQRIIPDATYRNWNAYQKQVAFDKTVPVMEAFNLLPDPQTNGGLLIAVSDEALASVQQLFRLFGIERMIEPIGRLLPPGEKRILVKP
ncbi:MAG TPA: selenide, water dikinase SelD [Ferruginibacter sp.]|nr:selenide, water dikinase SelD [Ferruginibacter sp.]